MTDRMSLTGAPLPPRTLRNFTLLFTSILEQKDVRTQCNKLAPLAAKFGQCSKGLRSQSLALPCSVEGRASDDLDDNVQTDEICLPNVSTP